jgi:hypothetical protein
MLMFSYIAAVILALAGVFGAKFLAIHAGPDPAELRNELGAAFAAAGLIYGGAAYQMFCSNPGTAAGSLRASLRAPQ